uniref:Ppx/GppA phosphatase N-terminal domain-containing protein n=1 Tax=Thermodesulfovibrio aggregans TaxID=86166 RepID=A0A7C4AIM8_9BACT
MRHTENIAVIDIGSNTLRLLVGNIEENKINKIYSARTVTRLGKNLTEKKFIDHDSVETSINTLKEFKNIAEKFNVSCIIAVGTSALREAENAKSFCDLVEKTLKIKIKIISGQQEAYYTLCGVMNEEIEKESSIFLIDVGGGSTEWIYLKNDKVNMGSIPVGALKINEIFLKEDPPLLNSVYEAKKFIVEEFKKFLPKLNIDKIIITGGTASTLAMINLGLSCYCPEKTHMSMILVTKIKQILEKLLSISLKERKKIKGIPSDRADIICAGLLILETIAECLNAENVIISESGILEGIMKNYKKFCYNNKL